MALESFEEWKKNKVQNVETTPSSGLLPLQDTKQSNGPESFQSWAQKKGIEIKPQNINTDKPDLQKIQKDIFNEMKTPAPFAKGIVDKISSMPANLFSPIVAEAPSSEDRLMGVNRTEQHIQDHPLSRLDNIITSNIAKGYTGGILHPESVKPETFGEKVASAFASGIGTISSIQAIEKNLAIELQTPAKFKSFISKYPKVAEYALPIIENILKNIPGFAVYGQLDPELKSTTDRLKRLAEDSAMAGTQSLLSPLPKLASVPLNGILFSGLAKLSGASNEDATAQGVVGMLFDSLSPRFKVSKELTVGKVNSILGEKAAETINKFSKTKITPESSDMEIKQAYIEAIKSSHPDLGGKLEDAASINAAKDILLKDNTLPINENNIPKDEVIIPKDGQVTVVNNNVPSQVNENPVIEPLIQEAKKYKSAEEFVKAQGKEIYHGTDKVFKEFDVKKTPDGSIWFTDNKDSILKGESGASGTTRIIDRFIDENKLKLAGWDEYDKYSLDELQNMGFDGIKLPDDGKVDYQIFYPEKLTTQSQLTDIWNKANKTNADDALIQEARKYKSAEEFVKAQGQTLYHGTPLNISELKNTRLGENNYGRGGVFLTPDKQEAFTYGGGYLTPDKTNARVLEVYVNPSAKIKEIDGKKLFNNENVRDNQIAPLVRKAEQEGYDGVVIRNTWTTSKTKNLYSRKVELESLRRSKVFSDIEEMVLTDKTIKNGKDYEIKYNNLVKESADATKITNRIKEIEKQISELDQRHIVIFNDNVLKTKSQLEEIWEKANKNVEIEPLIQEAKLAAEGNIMKEQSESQQVQPQVQQEQPNANMGVSKTAERVAQNFVDSGVPVDFQNIAQYKKIDIEEGFAKVANLINNDFQKAVNIFSGKEPAPSDINKTLLFEKMREYLIKNPDPELQYQMLNSPELTAISESAQNMRLAQEINTESAIGKAQEIKKVRTKRVGNTKLDKIKNDIKSISRESKKVNLSKEDLAWDKFLDEITC